MANMTMGGSPGKAMEQTEVSQELLWRNTNIKAQDFNQLLLKEAGIPVVDQLSL